VHYELVVYAPEEKALYIMAHYEWLYTPKDSSTIKPGDMDDYTSGRRKAGETTFKIIDKTIPKKVQRDNKETIDVTRFFHFRS
jgi:hypothetical protein